MDTENLKQEETPKLRKPKVPSFKCGKMIIDMVLCYESDGDDDKKKEREKFQAELKGKGIESELEYYRPKSSDNSTKSSKECNLRYLKLSVKCSTAKSVCDSTSSYRKSCSEKDCRLQKYAGILKINKPIKQYNVKNINQKDGKSQMENFVLKLKEFKYKLHKLTGYDKNLISEKSFYDSVGSCDPENCKISKEREENFNYAQRTYIVRQILDRTKGETENMGIQHMINKGIYTACYPLHEELQEDVMKDYSKSKYLYDDVTDRTVSFQKTFQSGFPF